VPLLKPAMWLKMTSRWYEGSAYQGVSDGNQDRHTSDDPNTGIVAGVDHVPVLIDSATFGLELVTDDLVVRPPLATLDVFCCWVYLNIAISYWADRT